MNYLPPKGNRLLRSRRSYLRSLIFKSPPDRSGNPYSYKRVHFAYTVYDIHIHNATFTHYVQCSVYIGIEHFAFWSLIHPSAYSLSAELLLRIVAVIDRNLVFILEAGFWGIGFFLFHESDSVQSAKIRKLIAQPAIRNVRKALIVPSAYISTTLKGLAVAHYESAYIIGSAIVNYLACSLAHIVADKAQFHILHSACTIV